MATTVKFRIVAGIAVLTILLGVYSAKSWPTSEAGSSFQMYYTAACLVCSGMSTHIYDVVDQDTNPQEIFADPQSVFSQTARAHGISRISLYLYPPTLADLIVPLTLLSPASALFLWSTVGILMILGLSLILTRMLDIRFRGSFVLVATFVLLFRPTLNTFHWGQVTILLAFLVTVGFFLYTRGEKSSAALLFALAVAIKLEPIAVIVPLIAWRDWKCLRSLVLWGILLFLGLWVVNGSHALNLYFLHQLPAMSSGTSTDVNRSFGNFFYETFGGTHPVISPRALTWLVRMASATILCYAGWLSRLKRGANATSRQQFEIGLVFLLLACCLSPYSWFYNWALTAPVVVLFGKRVWDGRADRVEIALLAALLLSLSTSRFNMAMFTPIVGVALGIVGLHRMRLERTGLETNPAARPLRNATAS